MHYNRCTGKMEYDYPNEGVEIFATALMAALCHPMVKLVKEEWVEDCGYIIHEHYVLAPVLSVSREEYEAELEKWAKMGYYPKSENEMTKEQVKA